MTCPACWSEALRLHMNGHGEGESVTEVYSSLIDEAWCTSDEDQRTKARTARMSKRPLGEILADDQRAALSGEQP